MRRMPIEHAVVPVRYAIYEAAAPHASQLDVCCCLSLADAPPITKHDHAPRMASGRLQIGAKENLTPGDE